MRCLRTLFIVPVPLLLAGCDSLFGPGTGRLPLTELPRQLSAAEQQVIQGSNEFAFGLLRETSASDTASNVFVSPLSASMALGMALNGARGETFEGMRSTLGWAGMSQEEINDAYRGLIDLLLELDGRVDMRIANALWTQQGFPIASDFSSVAAEYFGAEMRELDFIDPRSLTVINDWVHRGTNGRISSILDALDPEIVLYLMNAIYFKGSWTHRFDRGLTRDEPFHRSDGTQQQVRMMTLPKAKVRHFQTEDVQVVDLPYSREAFSMTFVLPGHGRSIDELVGSLDGPLWDEWMERLADSELDVQIPRFRLEYGQKLNDALRALGMGTALHETDADFSGISPFGEDLYIDEVRQKVFLEVNEEGTEAAAATSVGVGPTSAPPSFRADRPFLAVIRERLSGTILFIGTIGAPPPAP
jgi:serine protease inhibitor